MTHDEAKRLKRGDLLVTPWAPRGIVRFTDYEGETCFGFFCHDHRGYSFDLPARYHTKEFTTLEAFGKKQAPYLANNVAWAAQTQVNHWMTVLAGWKSMLGADWDKTYAASNTIYVARQNNVLFSVLAQFFPPDAVNDRLLLIETVSFTTTQADMLDSLTRIIADRSVGSLFFGNYHLMDYELMGGDARAAIIAESGKRGMSPFLPPVVPFGSHQWPTLITPGTGPASIADLK